MLGRKTTGAKRQAKEIVYLRASNTLTRKNSQDCVSVMQMGEEDFFYTLEGSAAYVWLFLQEKNSAPQLCKKLARKLNRAPNSPAVQAKVRRFLGKLTDYGLVDTSPI